MARGRRRKRRRRRSAWGIIFLVLLVILLVLLGILAYWVLSDQEVSLPKIPFVQGQSSGSGQSASTNWDEQPTVADNSEDEIQRLKQQYEAGRIDYGGVKKGLARIDQSTLQEAALEAYQDLNAKAEEDFSNTVDRYMNEGYYSEAYALLNRMGATLPDDEVTWSLIEQYQAALGM